MTLLLMMIGSQLSPTFLGDDMRAAAGPRHGHMHSLPAGEDLTHLGHQHSNPGRPVGATGMGERLSSHVTVPPFLGRSRPSRSARVSCTAHCGSRNRVRVYSYVYFPDPPFTTHPLRGTPSGSLKAEAPQRRNPLG